MTAADTQHPWVSQAIMYLIYVPFIKAINTTINYLFPALVSWDFFVPFRHQHKQLKFGIHSPAFMGSQSYFVPYLTENHSSSIEIKHRTYWIKQRSYNITVWLNLKLQVVEILKNPRKPILPKYTKKFCIFEDHINSG